jgi:hypothetical protein
MDAKTLEVTAMFTALVKNGQISPAENMEDLRFPGELPYIPTIATYGTPEVPVRVGNSSNAQLGQRTQGNFN